MHLAQFLKKQMFLHSFKIHFKTFLKLYAFSNHLRKTIHLLPIILKVSCSIDIAIIPIMIFQLHSSWYFSVLTFNFEILVYLFRLISHKVSFLSQME